MIGAPYIIRVDRIDERAGGVVISQSKILRVHMNASRVRVGCWIHHGVNLELK